MLIFKGVNQLNGSRDGLWLKDLFPIHFEQTKHRYYHDI